MLYLIVFLLAVVVFCLYSINRNIMSFHRSYKNVEELAQQRLVHRVLAETRPVKKTP